MSRVREAARKICLRAAIANSDRITVGFWILTLSPINGAFS